MLRQNQTKESSREQELEEEMTNVQLAYEKLQKQLNSLVEHNKQLSANLEDMQQDKERMEQRCTELLKLLDESRINMDTLQEEGRRQNIEHQEALKAQRLQIDTLNMCYKKQISDLNENHSKELETIRKVQNQRDDNRNRSAAVSEANKIYTTFKNPSTDEQKIDWILSERQEGEVYFV